VVYAPAGDLAFAAERGSIEFAARDAVRLRAEREVELAAGQTIHVGGPALTARVQRASLQADEAGVTARAIAVTAEKAVQLVGVLETTATRILERAKNVYRDVEELSQTRAGRMRLVVQQTFHLLGRRTLIRAEKDARIDGEKIYLG
jgi:hypothetical protein